MTIDRTATAAHHPGDAVVVSAGPAVGDPSPAIHEPVLPGPVAPELLTGAPAGTRDGKPVEQPAERPVEPAVERHVTEPVAQPVAQPVVGQVAEPAERPVEPAVEQPVEEPVEGPVAEPAEKQTEQAVEPVLPAPVRQRVIALAADTLGRIRPDEVPPVLRAAARFTPAKRARLAATALAATLTSDTAFRLRTAERIEQESPAAVAAVRRGEVPGAADPVELAVVAYLLRPPGWPDYLARARDALDEAAAQVRNRGRDDEIARLRGELETARSAVRAETGRLGAELDAIRAEVDGFRRQLREQVGLRRAAERGRVAAEEALVEERRRATLEESRAAAELRRLRQRLAESEDAVEAARRAARESRSVDEARLWLLLDTVTGAVQGLRRELALSPTEERPADAVAAAGPRPTVPTARGDDPGQLDRLLELPRVHLVVDGYNVTKTGYGNLPLSTQRGRLIQGLGALAARTGIEVSCVFDGAARPPAMPPAPRGLRVLFSAPGEIADDLIRRLVAAEPAGRPVVVVSSDREIADSVRASGAYPVASVLLLRRLDRG